MRLMTKDDFISQSHDEEFEALILKEQQRFRQGGIVDSQADCIEEEYEVYDCESQDKELL